MFVVGKNYRLQNIQLSKIRWGLCPQAPGSVARWGPKAQLRSLAGNWRPATLKSRESVYVGGRLGALLILQRSLRVLNPQQPNNGADVGCSEPEGPAARRNSFVKEPRAHDRARAGPKPKVQSLKPKLGGEYRARTGDLLVANQALSQLS